jgi:hypothetical protein
MRFLLDTHAFLWFVLNDPQLSQKALQPIVEPAPSLKTVSFITGLKITSAKPAVASLSARKDADCRVCEVSETWLQDYGNRKYESIPRQVKGSSQKRATDDSVRSTLRRDS